MSVGTKHWWHMRVLGWRLRETADSVLETNSWLSFWAENDFARLESNLQNLEVFRCSYLGPAGAWIQRGWTHTGIIFTNVREKNQNDRETRKKKMFGDNTMNAALASACVACTFPQKSISWIKRIWSSVFFDCPHSIEMEFSPVSYKTWQKCI